MRLMANEHADGQDFNSEKLLKSLQEIRSALSQAESLALSLVKIPFAEPSNPVWDEFHKRPHIHEIVQVFFGIKDAIQDTDTAILAIKYDNDNQQLQQACPF